MNQTSTPIERFFQSYDHANSTSNIPLLVGHFADVFFAAGPHGAKSVARADFARGLLQRKQLFDTLGCQSSTLVSLQETPLDATHAMARTRWQLTFVRKEGEPLNILVDSTFIVDTGFDAEPEAFKIILYLANQDIMQVLKDQGILPA
jgi:hypothetical protein